MLGPLSGAGGGAAAAVGEHGVEETQLSLATSRCTLLGELVSCAAALNMKPDDPELLVAEADALVQLKRPGEAIGVYRNALRWGAAEDAVNKKIAVAQSERRSFLDVCETQEGETAEHACESAWLPHAADEVTVFKRRGLLLQRDNQIPAALEAFMAAARLAPRDRTVARAIIDLSAGIEGDASILLARGAALMTLGRPGEAIVTLREALRLSPELSAAKERLQIAERSVPPQNASAAVAAANPQGTAADAGGVPVKSYTNDAPATRSN
jgi:tetratricopeptide (TPR) repeat protein